MRAGPGPVVRVADGTKSEDVDLSLIQYMLNLVQAK